MRDASLIESLGKRSRPGQSFGMPMEIRPIPETDRPGVPDPRELECLLWAETLPEEKTLEDIRANTGFPGKMIHKRPVTVVKERVEFGALPYELYIYRPFGCPGDAPALLMIHGGSWFAGTWRIVDTACLALAAEADCVVFSVEYALAPEHPFPAGLEQCLDALAHIRNNAGRYGIDPEAIAVGGDSAGGNLAASVALHAEHPPKLQILWYPATALDFEQHLYRWEDVKPCLDSEYAAHILPKLLFGRGDIPEAKNLNGMIVGMYLKGDLSLAQDTRVSPAFGVRPGMPEALIFTAEFDGLCPQGEYYAAAMHHCGNPVRLIRYLGVCHAFLFKTGILPQADDSVSIAARAIAGLKS